MAAMLIWGKGLQMKEFTMPDGHVALGPSGIDGGLESIAWSSVRKMISTAERHGVSKDIWPVYPDCDVESEAPIEDAQQRSDELRLALAKMDQSFMGDEDYWLRFVCRILRDGNSFFVMI